MRLRATGDGPNGLKAEAMGEPQNPKLQQDTPARSQGDVPWSQLLGRADLGLSKPTSEVRMRAPLLTPGWSLFASRLHGWFSLVRGSVQVPLRKPKAGEANREDPKATDPSRPAAT